MATDVKLALPNFEEGKLVIYTAKELDKREAVPLSFTSMHITTPEVYLAKRRPKVEDVVVIKNLRKRTILVKSAAVPGEGEVGSLQSIVQGQLNVNPDLLGLKINTDAKFSLREMKNHIKMNRRFFHVREQYDRLLKNLDDFSGKVQAEVQATRNDRGNVKASFEKTVTMDFDATVDIRIPLFDEFEPVNITVELCFDLHSSGTVEFYLMSEDLNELIDKEAEKIIGAEIEKIKEMNYMILQ